MEGKHLQPRESNLEYRLLRSDEDGSMNEEQFEDGKFSYVNHSFRAISIVGVGALFLGSICFNIVFSLRLLNIEKANPQARESEWAHLKYDVPTPIYFSTEYGPAIGTEEERARLWEALDISDGVIAIPDALALQKGLPLSHRFPWDPSQGIYMLGAFHQMHCLKQIYGYVSTTSRNITAKYPLYHVQHCLDALLQDVYCHADDTPWYQLPPAPYSEKYDRFQTRQCKDWGQLLRWTKDYNACYQYENVTDAEGHKTERQIDHYRFCPQGSPYTSRMENYFEEQDGAKPINIE